MTKRLAIVLTEGYADWECGLLMATARGEYQAATVVLTPGGADVTSLGGLAVPALQALMTERTPADAQGELQGALATLSSLTIILGPPLFALVFSRFSGENPILPLPGMPFLLSTLLAGAALLVLARNKPENPALQG